jgi:hypothetical protein
VSIATLAIARTQTLVVNIMGVSFDLVSRGLLLAGHAFDKIERM